MVTENTGANLPEGAERQANGQFAKGHKGVGGRPLGSGNRAHTIEDAICKRVGIEGQEGVVKWLSTLPDSILAQLFGRILPREHHVAVGIPWEEVIEEIESRQTALTRARAARKARQQARDQ